MYFLLLFLLIIYILEIINRKRMEFSLRETIMRKEEAERDLRIKLEYSALYDHLTSLPNRTLFNSRVKEEIKNLQGEGGLFAILFVDIDGFKNINDIYGHSTGDLILRAGADRLKGCVKDRDICCRMSGDLFCILLSDLEGEDAAAVEAKSLQKAFSNPFMMKEKELYISISIGISIYIKDGQDVESLMKNADIALNLAKNKGESSFEFYNNLETMLKEEKEI